ncbi:MAG: SRPBCC domain-containing protein [Bdellovibrionales bacterium]|nr:SRPBCC domain-containing protein [Bdellovibrionales bacterium]
MAAKNKPNEIYIERIYDAPVKMVWDAWVDPKQVAQWWGPRGFTLTSHSKDVRTGGHWDYTMHGPDGVDYPNITKYLEVEKHSRMVYDHGGNADQPPLFRVTVNFIDLKGKTKMEMTMAFATAEVAAGSKKFIKKAGGNSTWDRLAEYLEMESAKQDVFVINQTFDAPINLMFEVWTNPKHLSQWTGPAGSKIDYLKADIKPGGSAFYCMTGQGDGKIFGKATYLEIDKPCRIVYTQCFCDENEKVNRHPMAPTWPEVMKTTVLLEAEGPDQTRVTVKWEVVGDATPAERETFNKAKAGMSQGWGGSFDKLEEYLAKK